MEDRAEQQQLNLESLSVTELDQLWEQAKLELKQRAAHEQSTTSHRSSMD